MKNITISLVFFLSISLLIGCNKRIKTEPTKMPEPSKDINSVTEKTIPPTQTNESSWKEIAPDSQTSESMLTPTTFIPIDIWTAIDKKQVGKVTATEFVDYYVIKASEKEKLTGTEAYAKFKVLDRDGNGELTKQEATGAK